MPRIMYNNNNNMIVLLLCLPPRGGGEFSDGLSSWWTNYRYTRRMSKSWRCFCKNVQTVIRVYMTYIYILYKCCTYTILNLYDAPRAHRYLFVSRITGVYIMRTKSNKFVHTSIDDTRRYILYLQRIKG